MTPSTPPSTDALRSERSHAASDARAKVARRIVTVPLYLSLFLFMVATLPITLTIAVIVDLVRGTSLSVSRSLVFFTWYLFCESIGIVASFLVWAEARARGTEGTEAYLDRHYALQWWWARQLLRGAATIFGMRFEIEGDDDLGDRPLLLFIRHASVGDTVLAAVFLSHRHGRRLRYVLKRELLWDPCLDIVGNRLPNVFVRRDAKDSAREIAEVSRLAEEMGNREGLLIYPEGTRFTEAKRERILGKLAQRGPASVADRARSLRHVLPPKLGGPLALLTSRPDADVLFCAHVGFDRATRFSEFLNGQLIGATVQVRFWRVPAEQIPHDRDGRIEWLFDQWKRVDEWIAARRSNS